MAYPLALGGLSAVAVALTGAKIGAEGTVPMVLLAWTAAAIGFELLRKDGAIPLKAWMSAPVLATVALWILLLVRLANSPGVEYGTLKAKLFLAENVTLLIAGLVVGRRREHFDLYLILTVAVATVSAFVLVQQLATGQAQTTIAPGRETLFDLNPILLGRMSAEGLIIAVFLVLVASSPWTRVYALSALPILVVSLLAAGSRGPVLGVLFGLLALFALALRDRARRRRLVLVAIGGLGAFLLVQQLVPGQSIQRAFSVVVSGGSAVSANGRLELWSQAYDLFLESPLFGIGTGGFSGVTAAFYPHNLFLEVAVELGVVGLALLIAVLAFGARGLISAWKSGAERNRLDGALVLSLFGAALLNSQFSGAIQTNSSVWLALGLGLGLGLRRTALSKREHSPPT